MQGLLHDKIVVITGAGSGLGEAAALLARHGAKLVIGDIDGAAVERTAAAVKAESGAVQPMVCDVADEPAVEKLVRKAVDSYGRLDVIFNNAGITAPRLPARACASVQRWHPWSRHRPRRRNRSGPTRTRC